MRKRFVYLGALLALFFLSSYCDQEQKCKKAIVKKIAVVKNEAAAKHGFSKPLDLTNFFLSN